MNIHVLVRFSIKHSDNKKGDILEFFLFMYDIQHCFICRPTDSTASEDAGFEPRTVATTALTVRRSNPLAIYLMDENIPIIAQVGVLQRYASMHV